MNTTIFDTVFAVCDQTSAGSTLLHGTAFTLGEGVFVTTAHVIEELETGNAPHLRQLTGTGVTDALPIRASDRLEYIDIGFLFVDTNSPPIPMIDGSTFQREDVWSEGFAFGLDVEAMLFSSRHFKGYIVSTKKYNNWQEIDPSRTGAPNWPMAVHELSFAAPKGQSGSPLFIDDEDGNTSCIGMIIGNSKSSVATVSQSEVIGEGDTREVVEYHDFLYLGQSISSASMLDCRIGTLNRSIREHLGVNSVK